MGAKSYSSQQDRVVVEGIATAQPEIVDAVRNQGSAGTMIAANLARMHCGRPGHSARANAVPGAGSGAQNRWIMPMATASCEPVAEGAPFWPSPIEAVASMMLPVGEIVLPFAF